MTEEIEFDRDHAAVLSMDFQNEIVANLKIGADALLGRAATVLATARQAGLPVIHVVVGFRPGYPEVNPRNRVFSQLKTAGRFASGSEGVEIDARVAPRAGEVVVTRARAGAFAGSDLDTILRAQDITTIILLGIATSGVALSTARWAADIDYDMVIVSDGCGDRDDEVHRVLMDKIFPRNATVASAERVVAALTRGAS